MDAAQTQMVLTTSGDTGLLFKRMTASEELGHLFEFNVVALSDKETIEPSSLLGTPACVGVEFSKGKKRYFHGLVCAMGIEGSINRRFAYRLVLRPWLWLLTRRSDTRIFQMMNLDAILKQVFEPFSPDYELHFTGAMPQYEYCVQYRETDFNFVSRLMEQEGVYYYFKHEAGKHTMMIVDSPSAHQSCPHQESFEYRESVQGHLDFEPITGWHLRNEIQSGQVVLRDYDFQHPKTSLQSTARATRSDASTKLEVYDYPGLYPTKVAGDRYSKLRVEELQARYVRVDAMGSFATLATGYLFNLVKHPRSDQNKAHLVVSTQIECAFSGYESGEDRTFCDCHFTAMPGSETYRPRRDTPKPFVAGLHTAVVVGPPGTHGSAAAEIHTDKYGRVKIQFHWDRKGAHDDKSSCWVRVSSPWAGQAWGMISLPRIGQEVVVDFLEGDPDRPLITGRVYNGEQMPPYALPDNKTVSTNKSRSSEKGSASNFNELRFEDKKDSEYVWLQAEKDFHQLVKNDATLQVLGNQERLVSKNLTEKVDGDAKLKVGGDLVQEVVGSLSLKATNDVIIESAEKVSQKSGKETYIKAGTDLGIDATKEVHIKGLNVVIEAGLMLTLKAGGSTVVLGPSGVMVTGTMVMINSGGSGGSGSGTKPKSALIVVPPEKKNDPLA